MGCGVGDPPNANKYLKKKFSSAYKNKIIFNFVKFVATKKV